MNIILIVRLIKKSNEPSFYDVNCLIVIIK
jgi:hypothetical protein